MEWYDSAQDQNTMVALAKLSAAMFGTSGVVNGLACTQQTVANMTVQIGAGEIYQMEPIEATTCGTLPVNTANNILKQGIQLGTYNTAAFTAPGTGLSVNYLIQAQYQDQDLSLDPTTGATPVVLQFYNSANPTVPWSGPNNTGASSYTFRDGVIAYQILPGTAATTGTQTTPVPSSGWIGLWVVTVANGQSSITNSNISKYSNAPILPSLGVIGAVQANSLIYADDIGTVNAYALNLPVAPAAYVDGMEFSFSTTNVNTNTTPTLNVNGLGAVGITPPGGGALATGQIPASTIRTVKYNSAGPRFELQDGMALVGVSFPYADATIASDAVTAAYSVANFSVLTDGFDLTIGIVTPNTTTTPTFAPTINGMAQTARTIVKFVGNAEVAVAPGDLQGDAWLKYDGIALKWVLQNPAAALNGQVVQGAFKNLQASATGTGANVSVSADEIVVEDASNSYQTLRNVSLTINSAGAGANGLDTGTLSASTWYAAWVIWNRATNTISGLLSLSSTAPTMPSGYTAKARVGWVRTDGTANKYPLSFVQFGRNVQYKVAAGSNVASMPALFSGVQGSTTTPTWVAVAVGAFVPPTASEIDVVISCLVAGGSATSAMAAPNSSYGSYTSATNPPPLFVAGGATLDSAVKGRMVLESGNIYVASATSSGYGFCIGWEDNI